MLTAEVRQLHPPDLLLVIRRRRRHRQRAPPPHGNNANVQRGFGVSSGATKVEDSRWVAQQEAEGGNEGEEIAAESETRDDFM